MLFTIFTPTYNRKDKLSRVYNSLKNQNSEYFEWLIVDDGSTDHTEKLVKSFIEEKTINIRYIKQKNSGKHMAYNNALCNAKGTYFFCIDSDDYLECDFIDNFIKEISKSVCSGYIAYKTDFSGKLLSDRFPDNLEKTSLFDLVEKYHCKGEFSLIFNTEMARKYKFPQFENEKFMLESIIYDRMSCNYKFKLMPQIATICEYQDNGLTANYNLLMKRNPSGFCLYYMQRIDLVHSYRKKITLAGRYHFFKNISKNKGLNYNGNSKILVAMTKPLGIVFGIYYKIVRGF